MMLRCPAAEPLAAGDYPEFDVVVRSSVSVDRNLSATRFPQLLDAADRTALSQSLSRGAEAAGFGSALVGSLEPAFRSSLAERELYSRPYLMDESNIVALAPDRPLWMSLNEKNHVSLRAALPGLALDEAWTLASGADDAVSAALSARGQSWAFDADLGYVLSEAAASGNGLSASVLLHTPALVMAGLADGAFRKAMDAGFVVSGAYSASGASAGSLFGLALPQAGRDVERAALGRLAAVAGTIADYERRARERLFRDEGGSYGLDMLDAIGRALGRALYARLVSWDEAAEIVSGLRLGLSSGVLHGLCLEEATDLWSVLRMHKVAQRAAGASEASVRASALRKAARSIQLDERF